MHSRHLAAGACRTIWAALPLLLLVLYLLLSHKQFVADPERSARKELGRSHLALTQQKIIFLPLPGRTLNKL